LGELAVGDDDGDGDASEIAYQSVDAADWMTEAVVRLGLSLMRPHLKKRSICNFSFLSSLQRWFCPIAHPVPQVLFFPDRPHSNLREQMPSRLCP
jgi:hypothetical protein